MWKLWLFNTIIYDIKMKIAICHEHIIDGDAVGNDILGMANVLLELGFETHLNNFETNHHSNSWHLRSRRLVFSWCRRWTNRIAN